MALNTTFVSGAVLTAAQMNNLPMGIAGRSSFVTDKTFTTLVDTGLTITWTAVAARLYKLSLFGNVLSSAAATIQITITDSANTAISEAALIMTAGQVLPLTPINLLTGVSGSVTYKVRAVASAGTGTLFGSSTRAGLQAVFMVEDVGLA